MPGYLCVQGHFCSETHLLRLDLVCTVKAWGTHILEAHDIHWYILQVLSKNIARLLLLHFFFFLKIYRPKSSHHLMSANIFSPLRLLCTGQRLCGQLTLTSNPGRMPLKGSLTLQMGPCRVRELRGCVYALQCERGQGCLSKPVVFARKVQFPCHLSISPPPSSAFGLIGNLSKLL